jgi:DNA-binding NtrC family response regulator
MEDTSEAGYMRATPSEHTARSAADDEAGSVVERRHLLVFGEASSWIYALPAIGEVIIGRSETADLRIDDALVSRQHARLSLEDGVVTISDLGSQQGTYVNRVQLTGTQVLQPNDVIRIHRTTLILHATQPSARAGAAIAAVRSDPIAELGAPCQTLTIGGRRVIIADPTVARVYALVERLASVAIPVLITGETGCGKELVATALHIRSHRVGRELVSLNCAALHEMLVESELFGHEKGAFSGAIATKPGLIEAASGSTLFLDEIGELTPSNQAKLLRVLESHRVTRLGDIRERSVDVRIVAATNRDLEADVEAGRFRRDLYFRLSAATIHLPPLRQRPHELPLLAAEFLDEACQSIPRRSIRVSHAAMAVLLAHTWPGNVRELKNLMQYFAATLPGDELGDEQVSERLGVRAPPLLRSEPAAPAGEPRFRPLADELRELEVTRIREAIAATGGNQTRAAGLLGMPVRTFFEKAKLYGLTPKKRYDH